jgi:hypothetical protein
MNATLQLFIDLGHKDLIINSNNSIMSKDLIYSNLKSKNSEPSTNSNKNEFSKYDSESRQSENFAREKSREVRNKH